MIQYRFINTEIGRAALKAKYLEYVNTWIIIGYGMLMLMIMRMIMLMIMRMIMLMIMRMIMLMIRGVLFLCYVVVISHIAGALGSLP